MKKMPFNKPYMTGKELFYIAEAHFNNMLAGDGPFTKKCHRWLEDRTGCNKALLTHSCTAALEMAALLLNIQPGDEIIMPSYTFVSTANAFVLRGGVPVFVDIRADTLNLDECLIEPAIRSRTLAIVPVHYAGVACEMDAIMAIAQRHNLKVVEDRITKERLASWQHYHDMLESLESTGIIRRPIIPNDCQHNAHMYYVLLAPEIDRQKVLDEYKRNDIVTVFHYVPLHSSPAGQRYGRANGALNVTNSSSERLIRLPLWVGITEQQQSKVVDTLNISLTDRSLR